MNVAPSSSPPPKEDGTNLRNRHSQLELRLSGLLNNASKCRSEVSLVLRLLKAVQEAESSLSSVRIFLDRSQKQILNMSNPESINSIRVEIEDQIAKSQLTANTQIANLRQIASKFSTQRAMQRIEPVISKFNEFMHQMKKIDDEVRVRSEQNIRLQRPRGLKQEPSSVRTALGILSSTPIISPSIVKPLQSFRLPEGERLTLEVGFETGIPHKICLHFIDVLDVQATVTWLKDEQEICNPEMMIDVASNSSKLLIREIFPEDSAKYTCRVENPMGRAESSCYLSVLKSFKQDLSPRKRPMAQDLVMPKRVASLRSEPKEAPRFTEFLLPQMVPENEELLLKCRVVGAPEPLTEWFFENSPVDPRYVEILQQGEEHSLRIPSCQLSKHSGQYLCKAINPHGQATTNCQITVEAAEPPIITSLLENADFTRGDRHKLNVRFQGALPMDTSWFLNGQKIESGSGTARIINENAFTTTLCLPNVRIYRSFIGEFSSIGQIADCTVA
ncbi:hypothetical protein Ciccas_006551 [Cichlidogyrus casuarinus]|uniref:Ig-like domain-containing protein n=1 Tax=Cichlidogyrus casuarinus TaxID=1844966 RepID=A0ABD2Q5F8_9PLAT